jgi:hypothetical protein
MNQAQGALLDDRPGRLAISNEINDEKSTSAS